MKKAGAGAAGSTEEAHGNAVRLLFPPAVWALHFFSVYMAHTLLCGAGESAAATQGGRWPGAAIAILTAMAVLAIGAYVWRERTQPADVWRQASLVLALLVIFATVAGGAAAAFVSACGV
jgi:hypothetical protein